MRNSLEETRRGRFFAVHFSGKFVNDKKETSGGTSYIHRYKQKAGT